MKKKNDEDNSENPNKDSSQNKEQENEEKLENEPPIKRIFNYEKVVKYYKDQSLPLNKSNFIDQLFPPMIDSLYDKSKNNKKIDKINIKEIDWKRASELFPSMALFPKETKKLDDTNKNYINFKINYKQNKGELFSNYTHFFHAVSLMASIPGLIENIFKTKKISTDKCYELYVYINREYQIMIIDDYLPVVKNTKFLRFAKPNKEEIWLPLLEKAYAKANGGYGSLITCDTSSVFQFFTGVPVERINVFDLDYEDLKKVLNDNYKENYIFFIPQETKCKSIGIIEGKAYQLKDIFDLEKNAEVKNNEEDKEKEQNEEENNNEKSTILLKIYNMFECGQYKGKWSSEGTFFTSEIKTKVSYNEEDKNHIYLSLGYIQKFFTQIHIIHKIFDTNIKNIAIPEDSIYIPQVFNLYIPNDTKVSFSLIFKKFSKNSNSKSSVEGNKIILPSTICIAKFDAQEKKFSNFDGCFYSDEEGPETSRNLSEGFYVIWTYVAYDFCEPKPTEYELKVCSNEYFKLKIQGPDTKFHLIKNMLYSGIKQYQGEFIKGDEICVIDDNYYNFTGLGFEIIINPLNEYFQKWVFKTDITNMILLYPYSKFEHFEIQVLPNNFFILLGMKLDNSKKSKFSMKTYFKTLKYDEKLIDNPDNININFEEFCSEEVKKDERDFQYYQYLNDEGIQLESQTFKTNKVVYDYLYNNYTSYMNKINELPSLDEKEEKNLQYFEQKNLDGTYVGQVNDKNIKTGRGVFINSITGNYFVGYWKEDKKNGKGVEYNKDGDEIISGIYKNGTLNGQGVKILDDETKYEGMFLDGKMDGMGIYYFKDGTQWQGPSKNGLKNGKGTFTDSKGEKSDMEYRNNVQI